MNAKELKHTLRERENEYEYEDTVWWTKNEKWKYYNKSMDSSGSILIHR